MQRFYGPDRLTAKTQYMLEDVMRELAAERRAQGPTSPGQGRAPRGTPDGGRVAATQRPEPDVEL